MQEKEGYYVVKVEKCSGCHGGGCSNCHEGQTKTYVPFEEALNNSSMGKEFKMVMENIEKMMDITMQGVLATLTETIKPKGKH